MRYISTVSTILLIIGGLNWGLVGVFDFNLVTAIFGASVVARIIYAVVGVAALIKGFELMNGTDRVRVGATTDREYPRKVA